MTGRLYRYDVFISYSHKDRDWVELELLPRLEGEGFKVCVDIRNFKGGAFGIDEMADAVEYSRKTVAVFTEEYINSMWGKLENVMAQHLDPGAIERRLVPVLLKDCQIPLRLRILHFRDLRSDDPKQWNFLMRDLI